MGKIDLPKAKARSVLTSEPVIVITTVDAEGRPNGGAFGSYVRVSPYIFCAIHSGSDTYTNIMETKEFVVNVPGRDRLDSIMVFGRSYDEGVNEIKEAGLTEIPSREVKPPRIAEYKAHVECLYVREVEAGSHALLVGEMVAASCDEELWTDEGFDVVKAGVVHIVRYPRPVYIAAEGYLTGKATMDLP